LLQQVSGPALLVREVIPLAPQRAQTAYGVFRGPINQEVGQIEKQGRALELLRAVALEPKQLGQFHFGADLTADIAQGLVACGINGVGLGDGAVIHPHDDVVIVIAIG
jgi:hypothetical protein